MALPTNFLDPFDRTYGQVKVRMIDEAARLTGNESIWLTTLTLEFQRERNLWMETPELRNYWHLCERLRWRLLWLVTSAYLHMAYDLPRVTANNWPRLAGAGLAISDATGTDIYFKLKDVFPDTFLSVARDFNVTGYFGFLFRALPQDAVQAGSLWIQHLRSMAWLHAQRLAEDPAGRQNRERRMREAMAAALKHVSHLRLWSLSRLEPPDGALFAAPALLSSIDPTSYLLGSIASLATLAGAAAVVTRKRRYYRMVDQELQLFVDELGRRVSEYITVAVYSPEKFEYYIQARATMDGIEPNVMKS